jgi:carbon storage regulator
MLVLSRVRDEAIMIGDEIEITVVDVRGDKVRLGINAPPRVAVHRKEVYEAIRRENELASRAAHPELVELAQCARPGGATGMKLANKLSTQKLGTVAGPVRVGKARRAS